MRCKETIMVLQFLSQDFTIEHLYIAIHIFVASLLLVNYRSGHWTTCVFMELLHLCFPVFPILTLMHMSNVRQRSTTISEGQGQAKRTREVKRA